MPSSINGIPFESPVLISDLSITYWQVLNLGFQNLAAGTSPQARLISFHFYCQIPQVFLIKTRANALMRSSFSSYSVSFEGTWGSRSKTLVDSHKFSLGISNYSPPTHNYGKPLPSLSEIFTCRLHHGV